MVAVYFLAVPRSLTQILTLGTCLFRFQSSLLDVALMSVARCALLSAAYAYRHPRFLLRFVLSLSNGSIR